MPEADPVAVIGMGAVGTLLAGALASAGYSILACGRTPLASITVAGDAGSTSYPVTWTDQHGDLHGIRWAVLATKIHDTAAAAGWLAALSPGQYLLAAQNGVGQRECLRVAKPNLGNRRFFARARLPGHGMSRNLLPARVAVGPHLGHLAIFQADEPDQPVAASPGRSPRLAAPMTATRSPSPRMASIWEPGSG